MEAYGEPAIPDIASRVAEIQRQGGKYEKYLAERGMQPQVDWVADGELDEIEKRAKWTEANRTLFE